MIKLLRREQGKNVSPAQADHWLQNHSFERQRSIRDNRVNRIKHLMDEELFRPDTTITFCVLGEKEVLVNGYHTLTAIWQRKRNYKLSIEYYSVSTEEEIDRMYASFDPAGSARSRPDINRALDLQNHLGITNSLLANNASVAAGWIANKFNTESGSRSKEEDAEKAVEFKREIQFMGELGEGRGLPAHVKKILFSSPVLMVAMVLLRKDYESAREFFELAASNDGTIGFPPRFMVDYMNKMRIDNVRYTARHTVRKVRSEDFARVAITCYIRWKKGQIIGVYRSPQQTVAKLIKHALTVSAKAYPANDAKVSSSRHHINVVQDSSDLDEVRADEISEV